MRRNYPAPLRSVEAQLRRDKNTMAARVSRSRNKHYEEILQKKSTEMLVDSINWNRKIACYRLYASKLVEMLGLEEVDIGEMWEAFVKDKLPKEPKDKTKKAKQEAKEKGNKDGDQKKATESDA